MLTPWSTVHAVLRGARHLRRELYRLRWWLPWVCPLLGTLVLEVASVGMTCGFPGKRTETQLLTLVSRLDAFRLEYGRYPTTDEGLDAFLAPPPRPDGRIPSPFIDDDWALLDEWDNPFLYRNDIRGCDDGYMLWSRGPEDFSPATARGLVETRCRAPSP